MSTESKVTLWSAYAAWMIRCMLKLVDDISTVYVHSMLWPLLQGANHHSASGVCFDVNDSSPNRPIHIMSKYVYTCVRIALQVF